MAHIGRSERSMGPEQSSLTDPRAALVVPASVDAASVKPGVASLPLPRLGGSWLSRLFPRAMSQITSAASAGRPEMSRYRGDSFTRSRRIIAGRSGAAQRTT